MPRREKESRISVAWRYSNAAITEPVRQILLAPAPVGSGRVEGAERRIVQDRLVGVNEGVTETGFQGTARRRLKLGLPVRGDGGFRTRGIGRSGFLQGVGVKLISMVRAHFPVRTVRLSGDYAGFRLLAIFNRRPVTRIRFFL